MSYLPSHLLFLCTALTLSLLPLLVQAALPKELPASPAKFLTGACLTRSENLWITAEAGGVCRLSEQYWLFTDAPPEQKDAATPTAPSATR